MGQTMHYELMIITLQSGFISHLLEIKSLNQNATVNIYQGSVHIAHLNLGIVLLAMLGAGF